MDEMLGGTRITYLGHSTFRFVTAGGEQIIIDPWLADNPQTPEDLEQVDELHTILVTHGHFDHFDDAIPLAEQTGATVVANFEISTNLMGKGIENVMPMQKGGTAQVGGIQVTVVDALHASSIAEEDGTVVYGGEPCGYIVEFESGFKLYHAGDTGIFGDMLLMEATQRRPLPPRPRHTPHRQPGRNEPLRGRPCRTTPWRPARRADALRHLSVPGIPPRHPGGATGSPLQHRSRNRRPRDDAR